MDGKTYEPGMILPNNCNECTCESQPDAPGGSRWTCTNEACAIRPELIEVINDNLYGWRASNYSFLWGSTLQHGITYRLGTLPADVQVVKMSPLKVHINDVIPDNFDARKQWPGLIHGIRDQGDCGASWAFSTSAVASDRLAIVSKGILKDELSPQHLLSCDTKKQVGCKGGYLDRAWWFMRKWGTVTEECYPYKSGKMNEGKSTCLIRKRKVDGECPSGVPLKKEMRLKMGPPYRIRSEEREIMKEIIDFGPVQATFEVKADFFMYKSGIYKHTDIADADPPEFRVTGFHSVKIIGWGEEVGSSGTVDKYWLCANSWGADWGEQGYFRIMRGVNESGIESFVVGAWGRLHGNLRRLRRKIRQLRRLRRHKKFNKKKLHNLISLKQ